MTEINLDAINAAKKAHAARVVAKLAELKAEIASEPDIWFGGLPPVFVQINNHVDHMAAQAKRELQLPAD